MHMPDEPKWSHIDPTELVDYFDKDLSDDEEDRIELHLARCEECAQRARQASVLSSRWERWSAATQREAYLRSVVWNALGSAASEVPLDDIWKERINRWLSASSGLVEGVVKVTVEAVRKASQVATDGMEDLLRPGARWRFTLQPDSVAVRGVQPRRRSPANTALAVCSDGSSVRVKVEDHDGGTCEVVINVDQFPHDRLTPIVILTSIGQGGMEKPRLLQMRRQGQGLIARFRDLPAGEYLVAFEPLSAGNSH
jgi:hypothetical protein